MASVEFYQRKVTFEHAVQSARHVLEHPRLSVPDHPYMDELTEGIGNAVLGVLDPINQMVHTDEVPLANSVMIVPLTENDVKLMKSSDTYTFSNEMVKNGYEGSAKYNFSHMGKQQAECRLEDELVVPVIVLTPRLSRRTALQIGSTIAHEANHGLWVHKAEKVWPFGELDGPHAHAAMEISSYLIEHAIMAANDPTQYWREYRAVEARYKGYDFTSRSIEFKHGYPMNRNMRATAMVHLLIRQYGARAFEMPSDDIVRAMIAQDLIPAPEDMTVTKPGLKPDDGEVKS